MAHPFVLLIQSVWQVVIFFENALAGIFMQYKKSELAQKCKIVNEQAIKRNIACKKSKEMLL